MIRLILPNRRSFTPPLVYPTNWKTSKSSISILRRIRYRYYDPIDCPQGKQFTVCDMNRSGTNASEKTLPQALLQLLHDKMHHDLWNPITGKEPESAMPYEVHPNEHHFKMRSFCFNCDLVVPKALVASRRDSAVQIPDDAFGKITKNLKMVF